MTNEKLNSQESIKKYIRVFLKDENGKQIKCEREDKYSTTVDIGYEDLDLRDDDVKISLYQNSEYIELWDGRVFKVLKRIFMPCCPVCLYLTLKEIN